MLKKSNNMFSQSSFKFNEKTEEDLTKEKTSDVFINERT